MIAALVALGGAAGAVLRFLAGQHLDGRFPWGTLLVNTVGSGLLGLVAGLSLSDSVSALLAVGFCGGLTTYSAFVVEVHARSWRDGTVYAGVTVLCGLGACAAGYAAGR
jgi:fluoride exporter